MVDEICHICNDKATGKHYGAISCDGCKGFFRRSIRKKRSYVCRFDHNCPVDKNHRNSCRACRLRKCLIAGMKSNAIQNERDTIGKRKKPLESLDGGGPETSSLRDLSEEMVIELLLQSERLCQQLRSSVIKSTEQVSYDSGKTRSAFAERFRPEERRASIDDIGKSIRQQLLLLVEWAKSLPQFQSLTLMDQACLLKANATQIIVLGVAYRSVSMEDTICLANDALISREHAALVGDINCVVRRILDELVVPIRRLSIELPDYVALKAIVFFNPVSHDVTDYERVDGARLECLAALEKRCARIEEIAMRGGSRCRLGRLLLLLPPLQAIAQQLIEDVQLAAVFGVANVDALMQELILQDASANNVITTLAATPTIPIKVEP
ncbi:unnamed protein product, partial [Mesorhabditis belari]|uniref:Uncharacterized protein n=1 Tax=Mesorhabditis belari TaxID=2138241 RepID=A0AAF3F3S9_9BILA